MKSPEFIPTMGVFSGLMVMAKSDIFHLFWNGGIYVKQEKSEIF